MELENTLDNKLTIENYNYETFLDDYVIILKNQILI